MELKVGNTPLIRSQALSKLFKLKDVLIKDESKNPFGTYKDRVSEIVIKKALKEYVNKIVLITSGNAGYSFAKFAEDTNIKVVCLIDKSLSKKVKRGLQKVAYRVVELDLSKRIITPEEVISIARETPEEVIWEVTNGFHEVYKSIVEEVAEEKPDYIVVPVGSGEAFVGIYDGIKKHHLNTKLIGIGVKQKWSSFADKLWTPFTPYKEKIKAIVKAGHKYFRLNESEVRETYSKFKNLLNGEPSSTVVFAVFSKYRFKPKDKIILINSGKGNF